MRYLSSPTSQAETSGPTKKSLKRSVVAALSYGKVKAKLAPTDPIKNGLCGDAAPYRLTSLGSKHLVVSKPVPVFNCPMIQAADVWLRNGLQPLAKRHLGGPITRVSVMSSYSCQNA